LYVWQKITKVTTPYFYIIKHKPTGKKYAGSRWAKGCHPDEFMKDTGYCTSSPIVKDLIKSDGLDAFEVLTIELMDDPYTYETEFLQKTDCAKSDEWLNMHNNTGLAFGTEYFIAKTIKTNLVRYGVECVFKLPEIQKKIKETSIKKWGVSHPPSSEYAKAKIKKTNFERYGVECSLSSDKVREKAKKTIKEKYGVENVFANEDIKQKIKNYWQNNFGVTHQSKIKEIRNKTKETLINRYGVNHPSKIIGHKEKTNATWLKNLGVDNPQKSPQVKAKTKKTNMERYGCEHPAFTEKGQATMKMKYGVNHNSKLPFVTILENKKTYAKCFATRYFPELKEFY
jgi:hypothetical protein